MSEEEAISICKNIIRSINGDTCYMNYSKEQDKEAIETILDLYNKQKQELDSVKEIYYTQSEIENNYISKDLIREKLEILVKGKNDDWNNEYFIEGRKKEAQIDILKELLEE